MAAPAAAPARLAAVPGVMLAWAVGLCGATVAVGAWSSAEPIRQSPVLFALLVAAVVALDYVNIDLFGRGEMSPGAVPVLALAYFFGPLGPLAAELVIAVQRLLRGDKPLDCAIDLGLLSLAGAGAAATFAVLPASSGGAVLGVAILAGLVYYAANGVLLAITWTLREGVSPVAAWRERFAWCAPHYLAYGAITGMFIVAQLSLGLLVLPLFGLPMAMLWVAQKQYLDRSRDGVDELRASHARLRTSNTELERANDDLRSLLEANEALLRQQRQSYLTMIASLARTIEAKDPYTGGHTERVAAIAVQLAAVLGIAEDERQAVEDGAVIHDIGKIGIPDRVLLKQGKLDDDEFAEMRRHPAISSYIVEELDLPNTVKAMARSHHERFDGRGYPDGLRGEAIPLPARILTVADSLDAMISDRPYRAALPLVAARAEIARNSGTQFCPAVVAALDSCFAHDAAFLAGPVGDASPEAADAGTRAPGRMFDGAGHSSN